MSSCKAWKRNEEERDSQEEIEESVGMKWNLMEVNAYGHFILKQVARRSERLERWEENTFSLSFFSHFAKLQTTNFIILMEKKRIHACQIVFVFGVCLLDLHIQILIYLPFLFSFFLSNMSRSVTLDGEHMWKSAFQSGHRFSLGFMFRAAVIHDAICDAPWQN